MAKPYQRYSNKIGDWGEAVAAAAFRRGGLTVSTQPIGNRIPLIDMTVSRRDFLVDVQVKATATKGQHYKLDFGYVRDILAHIEAQEDVNNTYRFALAVVNIRKGGVFVFNETYIANAFDLRNRQVLIDRVPGSVPFYYEQSSRLFGLNPKEIAEGVEIARAFCVDDFGGWTDDLFD